MKRVIIESPYAGDLARNRAYLGRCIRDSILRGENPYASHAIIPLGLNDANPEERQIGIELGYDEWRFADAVVFYTDYGMSNGMQAAMDRVSNMKHLKVETRLIGENP